MMSYKKRILICAWLAMFFVVASFPNVQYASAAESIFDLSASDFSTKRLILQTTQKITDDSAIQIEGGYGGFYVLEYATEEDTKKAYETFYKMDSTKAVQPDGKAQLMETENDSGKEQLPAHTFMSWGAQKTGIDEVYYFLQNSFTELPQVKVAVLDTGIDMDLAIFEGRILSGGKNYCSKKKTLEDDNGHGTAVSGIIVDQTLSNVKILPLKVMDKNGEGYDSQIVLAMLYALECDVDIINMSIGGDGEKEIYENVLEMARQQGVPVIAAAGNESGDVQACTPANIETTVAVSSINKSGMLSGFSNYGSTIDFTAPGESIHVVTIGGGSKYVNGTSFATPHVTVAFALMKSWNNSWDGEDIYQILKEHARDLGPVGWDEKFGYGMINLKGLEKLACEPGDVDEDGIVTSVDAYYILQMLVGRMELTEFQMWLADANKDGAVNSIDALWILQKEVGK